MNNKKTPYLNLIGGILFVILFLWQLYFVADALITAIRFRGEFAMILSYIAGRVPYLAIYALMAFTLLANWRTQIPSIGICVYGAWRLLQTLLRVIQTLFDFDFRVWLGNIPGLLEGAAFCVIGLMALICLNKLLPHLRPMARSLWFVPAACLFLAQVVRTIISLHYITFASILNYMLVLAAWAAASLWIVSPAAVRGSVFEYLGANSAPKTATPGAPSSAPAESDGYFSMAAHVLLLLFGFGIWQYIWVYRTTKYLNRAPGMEQRNPTTKLLLCMFVPFYYIYWVYQSAKRIDALSNSRGIPSDSATLCLILQIFIGIVPPILMQSKINTLASLPGFARPAAPVQNHYAPPAQPQQPTYAPPKPQRPAAPAAQQPSANSVRLTRAQADELRRYKDLYDQGIITKEDFIAKRRQILEQ